MRRRLGRIVPIFGLALLVQLLAPISAFRFVATAVTDPVALAPLCAAMAAANNSTSPTLPDHGGGCCAICASGIGGAPVLGAAPEQFAAVDHSVKPLVWRHADQAPPRGHHLAHAQARGPPPRAV